MGNYMYGAALSGQTVWFLGSIVVGAVAMLLYTLVRVFTRGRKKASVTVAVGDILFFVLLACLEFLFVFMLPQNALRWFHILGQILGGIIFWLSLAPFCFKFFLFIKKIIVSITAKVLGFTCWSKPLNYKEEKQEQE